MIVEMADIRIRTGTNADFEKGVRSAISTVFARAEGFQGCTINRSIESSDRYILQGFWNTLEDHTVTFRQGPLYAEWLAIVRPFAAAQPGIEHFEILLSTMP